MTIFPDVTSSCLSSLDPPKLRAVETETMDASRDLPLAHAQAVKFRSRCLLASIPRIEALLLTDETHPSKASTGHLSHRDRWYTD
jgi:hypothetical protein